MKPLLIALGLGVAGYLLALLGFSEVQARLIGCVFFLVSLWTNEALPLGVVSLSPIVLFPVLGIAGTDATSANYAKSIIFLFLGGFMLALAVEKTGLHKSIARRILTIFPNTPRGIITALAFTSAILSAVLSNTTTALLLLPIALFLTERRRLKTRFALAIAYGASIGGIMTPIGTPPNLIFMQFLQEHQMATISFVRWMLYTMPLTALMLVVVTQVLSLKLKDERIDLAQIELKPINRQQKQLIGILGVLVLVLFANSPLGAWPGLGLNENGVLLSFGMVMFLPGLRFLDWGDCKKIPYEIIFLFGAGFSLAMAFSGTGLADSIAGSMANWQSVPFGVLLLLVALLVTFTTEITSNTALISVMLPVIYAVGLQLGFDPMLLLMVATLCASYAFMLPIATPPNAIAMSSGVVKVKDMATFGLVFNLSGVALIYLMSQTLWKWML